MILSPVCSSHRGLFFIAFCVILVYDEAKGGENVQTTPMTLDGLVHYLAACKAALPHDAIFVCGHDAPDTDAVVSSIAESYRRYLVDGTPAVPIITAQSLPTEIAWLLAEPLSSTLLYAPNLSEQMTAHDTRFILTDHHAVQNRRVIAIIDHHLPRDHERFDGIDTDIRPVGAATTLVVQRCLANGLVPDAAMARILLGAVLADTEGLSHAKARAEDRLAAEQLATLWGGDASALFSDLRASLLSETDLFTLYHRDYRRFDNTLGFAVLKTWSSTPVDEDALRQLLADDCRQNALTATIAKLSRYGNDGLKEERYFISATPELAKQIAHTIRHTAGEAATSPTYDTVELPAQAIHLSRKGLAPLLLRLLKNLQNN